MYKKIMLFFKKIFGKKNKKLLLESSKNNMQECIKSNFIEQLKIEKNNEKVKVETLICIGDGLGIQRQLKY